MESCIQISLSEYIVPDQSQRFDHSGRNEIWREPFPPARTCDRMPPRHLGSLHCQLVSLEAKCALVTHTKGFRVHSNKSDPGGDTCPPTPGKIFLLPCLYCTLATSESEDSQLDNCSSLAGVRAVHWPRKDSAGLSGWDVRL